MIKKKKKKKESTSDECSYERKVLWIRRMFSFFGPWIFFQLLIFFQFDTFIFSLFGIQLNNLVWIFSQY